MCLTAPISGERDIGRSRRNKAGLKGTNEALFSAIYVNGRELTTDLHSQINEIIFSQVFEALSNIRLRNFLRISKKYLYHQPLEIMDELKR